MLKRIRKILFQIAFLCFACFGVTIFAVILVRNIRNSQFDLIQYLSSFSSFFVALLTLFYVNFNDKQLRILDQQLIEMKNERELQNQPLPISINSKLLIDVPQLYFDPKDGECIFFSRYTIITDVKNAGIHPAVDIRQNITINSFDNKGEPDYAESSSKYIYVLEEKAQQTFRYLFANNNDNSLIKSLVSIGSKNPRISIKIYFRNILGGVFFTESKYVVNNITQEQESALKEWYNKILSFYVNYDKELQQLRTYYKRQDQLNWRSSFDKLMGTVNSTIVGKPIEILLIPLPISSLVNRISEIEYDECIANTKVGTPFAAIKGDNKKAICRQTQQPPSSNHTLQS